MTGCAKALADRTSSPDSNCARSMEFGETECKDGDKKGVTVTVNKKGIWISGYILALGLSATMVSRRSWHELWFALEVAFV